jgi:phospholipid/cholesterol/gamma-HCH transport system substrate-binding protein
MAPQREHHEHHATHTYFDTKPHPTLAGKSVATASFVLLCFAGILATTHLIGTPLPFVPEYTVSAILPNAEDVIPDSQVTIGGATAGRVDEVSLTPQGAKITMRLFDRWQHIHRDATASVRVKSLLGERFVNIDPGSVSQPELPSGSTMERTGTLSVELTDVLNMLDPHTRSDLGVLISSMAASTAGRATDINTAIRDLRSLVADMEPATDTVAKRAADVQHLIASADSVTRDLAGEQGDLAALVDRANSAVGSLNRDRTPLLTVIDQGDRLSTAFSNILEPRTQAGLRETVLHEVSSLVNT